MKKLLFLIFFAIPLIVFSQKNIVNPNGYNKFFYETGIISSEGNMQNGLPVGFWKSYHLNGILKAEGYRNGEVLDSIWKFYDDKGNISKLINYRNNKKNGYYFNYKLIKDSLKTKNILISKELYLDDELSGKSYYYSESGILNKSINYELGRKHGDEIQYETDGRIILILKYKHGNLTDSEKINRYDSQKRKQGTWKEFYQNGNPKIISNYKDDLLNGYYREYDPRNQIILQIRYLDGKVLQESAISDEENTEKSQIKEELFGNGKVKKRGAFVDNKPIGIHTEYDENGVILNSEIFDNQGNKESDGLIDKNGQKTGIWKFYFQTGEKKAEGNYVNGKRTGKWTFYYVNGEVEQKGSYKNGKTTDIWQWFYENGKILREGTYEDGKEQGYYCELSEIGDTISYGNYSEGMKIGNWYLHVNDHIETGEFLSGRKNGTWKYFYILQEKKEPEFIGTFADDMENGGFIYFYPSGTKKLQGEFSAGIPVKTWKKFDEEGNIETTTVYRNGKKYKIDGKKIKNYNED